MLVVGDFNVNLAIPEGERRAEDIATTLTMEGLEDMAKHFLPRESRWCWDWSKWGMLRKGREVWSRTDYILGTDRRLFRNVAVQDPRQATQDHVMVRVVPRVLECDVPENTAVCPQDVVCLGPHLPSF